MLKSPFSLEGRIRRSEYLITVILACFFVLLTDSLFVIQPILSLILFAILQWFFIAQSVKRSHDIGNSGWFLIIPLYSVLILFIDSFNGRNKYGQNPKSTGHISEFESHNKSLHVFNLNTTNQNISLTSSLDSEVEEPENQLFKRKWANFLFVSLILIVLIGVAVINGSYLMEENVNSANKSISNEKGRKEPESISSFTPKSVPVSIKTAFNNASIHLLNLESKTLVWNYGSLYGSFPEGKYSVSVWVNGERKHKDEIEIAVGSANTFFLSNEIGDSIIIPDYECPEVVYDIDNNEYKVVKIGYQCWFASNLKTKRYNNGVEIIKYSSSEVIYSGTWSIFENNQSHSINYGLLYDWYAVTSSNQICPDRWRVAKDWEWDFIINYVNQYSTQLSNINTPQSNRSNSYIGTDNSIFSTTPGGIRFSTGGYSYLGDRAHYWSSTSFNESNAIRYMISTESNTFDKFNVSKLAGLSVRCMIS